MGIVNSVKNKMGVVTVQIEGFFTERFINLCKINNIKIWDIRNIVKGVIRFKINIYDFKKLRKVAKKTKCKVKIKNKKGAYFVLFKYRKRSFVFFLILFALVSCILFSTFIWKIEVVGNINIPNEKIIEELKNSGIYVGKNKIGLDKKQVINDFRTKISDITWVGIEIKGSKVKVELVEKTKLDDDKVQNSSLGNIIASKSGVITKIIPENGTAVFKEGSYIEEGAIAIEGALYSKYIEPIVVVPKGIVRVSHEYINEKTYLYQEILREYTNKTRYTIGVSFNSKENMLNYLNKEKKYDITKESKSINLFGNNISFDIYTCKEYNEIEITNTKGELIERANNDIENYLKNEIFPNTKEAVLENQITEIVDLENGIKVVTKYIVNEEVGTFVAGEPMIRYENEGESNE